MGRGTVHRSPAFQKSRLVHLLGLVLPHSRSYLSLFPFFSFPLIQRRRGGWTSFLSLESLTKKTSIRRNASEKGNSTPLCSNQFINLVDQRIPAFVVLEIGSIIHDFTPPLFLLGREAAIRHVNHEISIPAWLIYS